MVAFNLLLINTVYILLDLLVSISIRAFFHQLISLNRSFNASQLSVINTIAAAKAVTAATVANTGADIPAIATAILPKTINNGPVVSLYEFEPAPGIKVSKIINLSEDLARNTSSTSARVSVIPGKNTVGIEIPNEIRESVSLREIISYDKFQKKT